MSFGAILDSTKMTSRNLVGKDESKGGVLRSAESPLQGANDFRRFSIRSNHYRGNYTISAPLRSVQSKRPLDILHPCAGCRQLPLSGLAARKHLALQAAFSRQVLQNPAILIRLNEV